MRVAVIGLWHLGCVTAACLAAEGHDVVGLDPDAELVSGLAGGRPPLHEPGLQELLAEQQAAGRLRFTTDPGDALAGAAVSWVCFDTPVDDDDEADVDSVRDHLRSIGPGLDASTLLLVSSQVPAGFTREIAGELGVRGAYSPENLRLGKALEVFRHPERVVVGLESPGDRELVEELLAPFTRRIEWMSIESAEMCKHALNAFLATSVTFANELARLCERVGANAKEVERGLKSEGRIGPKAYLAPGAAFAGGTLARDVRFLRGFGSAHGVATPLFDGVLTSNEAHKGWVRSRLLEALREVESPVVAFLGLTYKPGTDTLRRSLAMEVGAWLADRDIPVQAHDPSIGALPAGAPGTMSLHAEPRSALEGADAVVLATEWPDYAELTAEDFVAVMRTPRVIDQNWFLAGALSADHRVTYMATGRSTT